MIGDLSGLLLLFFMSWNWEQNVQDLKCDFTWNLWSSSVEEEKNAGVLLSLIFFYLRFYNLYTLFASSKSLKIEKPTKH